MKKLMSILAALLFVGCATTAVNSPIEQPDPCMQPIKILVKDKGTLQCVKVERAREGWIIGIKCNATAIGEKYDIITLNPDSIVGVSTNSACLRAMGR